jgi:16S rRNA (guanine(966)-N(2))-methyltransferase RsmD
MANPRIISGTAKGMRLKTLPGTITRPITDRVKENLFNIIGFDIIGSYFLDMFGGSGSVGIESLSRGAAYAEFIEVNAKAYAVLQDNLSKSRLGDKAKLINADAFRYLRQKDLEQFDYIFIAPPQYHGLWKDALILVDNTPALLNEGAWVIVQIDPIEDEEIDLDNLSLFDKRKYGSTVLNFYSPKTQD